MWLSIQKGFATLHTISCHQQREDGDYIELSKARFVKISLFGDYRQFWIDQIDVYFRHIILDGPLPPPPPLPIASPLSPPAPPDPPMPPPLDACTIFPNLAYREQQATLLWEVGCGMSRDDCCGHARQASKSGKSVNGFKLSAAGCCDMIFIVHTRRTDRELPVWKIGNGSVVIVCVFVV